MESGPLNEEIYKTPMSLRFLNLTHKESAFPPHSNSDPETLLLGKLLLMRLNPLPIRSCPSFRIHGPGGSRYLAPAGARRAGA